MRALIHNQTSHLVICLALVAAGHVSSSYADEPQKALLQLHSYQDQMTVDEYNQSARENRRQLRSYAKSTAQNAFSSVGIPQQVVGYMGAAIGLATRDSRLHLNASKSLSLELMDLTQDNRGVFFGYSKRW